MNIGFKQAAILGVSIGLSTMCISVPMFMIRDKEEAPDKAITIEIDWRDYADSDTPTDTVEEFQEAYEQARLLYESSTYSSTSTYTESKIQSSTEVLEASKYIASHFVLPPGQQCYSNHSKSPHNSIYGYSAHNGKTMFSTKIPMRGIMANVRHDCSGYVGAMEFYLGYSNSPLQPGNWYWYTMSVPGFEKVDAVTYADCQIGDAFHTSGHCAMIVDIRDGLAYFGDCGSCRGIEKTATYGYSYTHKLSEPVSNWRSAPHIILRAKDK